MKRRQQCMNASSRDCQLTKLMQFSQDEDGLFFYIFVSEVIGDGLVVKPLLDLPKF